MAKMPTNPYSVEVRTYMMRLYGTLNEKGRRQYAAIEAVKLGHGGITYVCDLFGLHRDTVSLGIRELKDDNLPPPDRVRRWAVVVSLMPWTRMKIRWLSSRR